MIAIFFTAFVMAQAAPATSAEAVMTRAVIERMGDDVGVTVRLVAPAVLDGAFASARPDPLGRVGGEMGFSLTPAAPGARVVRVRARVEVVAEHVLATRAVLRGHNVTAADLSVVRGPITGVPVQRLPQMAQVLDQRALRPIAAGQILESSLVTVRHLVQAGDIVTVVALVGSVQVTATFVASDSGDPGDVVRVFNRETHRSVRARVVSAGVLEVIDGQ